MRLFHHICVSVVFSHVELFSGTEGNLHLWTTFRSTHGFYGACERQCPRRLAGAIIVARRSFSTLSPRTTSICLIVLISRLIYLHLRCGTQRSSRAARRFYTHDVVEEPACAQ